MKCDVLIASRIYLPEPSAASFRLGGVQAALTDSGANVLVLTARVPQRYIGGVEAPERSGKVQVRRSPVLRDRSGYLRGYLPYMSFDVPLFFRLLAAPRPGVILVEPPPTTGAVVRVVAALRRIPYVWYAADVWSDATQIAGASKPVVAVVRALERFVAEGAAGTIAVSDGVAERMRQLGSRGVTVVPGGIDTRIYSPEARPLGQDEQAKLGIGDTYFLYAGTASEWQDALVFAKAMKQVARVYPEAQLVFAGQGSQWQAINEVSGELKEEFGRDVIIMLEPQSPDTVARLLRGARAAAVSIVPGVGYDFAYPTKVLAALSAGTRVLFAGTGPAASDIEQNGFGLACAHDPEAAAAAMQELLQQSKDHIDQQRMHRWVEEHRSLSAMGKAAAEVLRQAAQPKSAP